MRFPIDIVFARRDGIIVKTSSRVPPWRLAARLGGYAVIELPPGVVDQSCTQAGDVLVVVEASHAA
jgi:uncharacterized membrane protein (UPF0127 family)